MLLKTVKSSSFLLLMERCAVNLFVVAQQKTEENRHTYLFKISEPVKMAME